MSSWSSAFVDIILLDLYNFSHPTQPYSIISNDCWFLHDVIKIQTRELAIVLSFYFHEVLQRLKTIIQTNLHFVFRYSILDYYLKFLTAFTWRTASSSYFSSESCRS